MPLLSGVLPGHAPKPGYPHAMMLRRPQPVGSWTRFALRSAGVSLVLLLQACSGVSDKNIENMTGVELRRMVDDLKKNRDSADLLLIDPRNPRDYAAERIPGAQNLRLSDVPPDARVVPSIDRFGTIVVYGNDPASASAKAMTKRLITVGYSSVRFFPGGLEEWKSLGGEVETTK